ncbi:hypothetical protein N1851_020624 [Merluccius polli]|uniref:Uncharacterized protein n=1 Tax=Merluccius polli TaxID=89951 RepID=A0AA47NWV1_MERPO|nr:hypothetical protein N1851_020624 [Merluccius polli]
MLRLCPLISTHRYQRRNCVPVSFVPFVLAFAERRVDGAFSLADGFTRKTALERARHSPSMVNLQSLFERKYHTFSRSTTHLI